VIFVTVGTQLPFDRLIEAVDAWAGAGAGREVFAQVGPSAYAPSHVEFAPFISPEEHRRRMGEADAIVAHAGMGTILGALQLGKPLLVMPRSAVLGEHRNDHQIATSQRFGALGRVAVAMDAEELAAKLDELDRLNAHDRISQYASDRLISALSTFISA
jgi:UDP-N-acetylglucosamine transferase subunit ALG13